MHTGRLISADAQAVSRRDFSKTIAAGMVGGELTCQAFVSNHADAQDKPVAAGSSAPTDASAEPVCVADFRELAKQKLPGVTFDYIDTGTMDQVTLRENVAAFQRLNLVPPILTGVRETNLETTVLGQPVSMPILLAPVAAQRMYHPEGALAVARAAEAIGTVFGVSSSVTNSVEEVAKAAAGPKWFQLYPPKDREVARRLVQRAERAGFRAIAVTVDMGEWKDADRRNRFSLPREMLIKHLRDVGFEEVSDRMTDEELRSFNSGAWDQGFGWDFFDWMRTITKLPLLVKGVLRPEDAQKAVEIGLDGIIVSNHGGRRLDSMPASIDALPAITKVVRGRTEVFLDSGIRRGTDVLKALALGARAVLVGRPYVWALAVQGEAGVRRVLEILRDELRNVLVASGCRDVHRVPRSLVKRAER